MRLRQIYFGQSHLQPHLGDEYGKENKQKNTFLSQQTFRKREQIQVNGRAVARRGVTDTNQACRSSIGFCFVRILQRKVGIWCKKQLRE